MNTTMSYQNREEDQRTDGLVKKIEERLELSAAWRELLGLEASAPATSASSDQHSQPAAMVAPILANDPWSALLQAKGIEVIDLQKLHTQTSRASLDERDVELALKDIQEQQS
jgi:hypothetical protein